MSGPIRFDETGSRTDFKLRLLELTREGLKHVCWPCTFGVDGDEQFVLFGLLLGGRLDSQRSCHIHEQLYDGDD